MENIPFYDRKLKIIETLLKIDDDKAIQEVDDYVNFVYQNKKLSPFQRTHEELIEELNISLDQMEKGLTVGQEEISKLLKRYQ